MSAIGEIESAIVLLTQMRNQSKHGPWTINALPTGFDARWDYVGVSYAGENRLIRNGSNAAEDAGLDLPDAMLIVTLHRTIHAQLAILRECADLHPYWVEAGQEKDFWPLYGRIPLELARAINGADS